MDNITKKVIIIIQSGIIIILSIIIAIKLTPPPKANSTATITVSTPKTDVAEAEIVEENLVTLNEPKPEPVLSQEEIWMNEYRGNQLSNGSLPYRKLYGYNNSESSSEITIKAPLYEDVIVIVKNHWTEKVRGHAYIRKDRQYTIPISGDNTYDIFFIFGKDWCPEKEAPNGQLGYFLTVSAISKDESVYIDNYKSLSYTLQSVEHGNFRPDSSNSEEAF